MYYKQCKQLPSTVEKGEETISTLYMRSGRFSGCLAGSYIPGKNFGSTEAHSEASASSHEAEQMQDSSMLLLSVLE